MFAECKRHSDDELLFIPGEEANKYLGLNEPGKNELPNSVGLEDSAHPTKNHSRSA